MASRRSPSRAGVSTFPYPYIGRRSERSVSTEIRTTGALSNRGPAGTRLVPLQDGTARSREIPPRRAAKRAGAISIWGRRIASTRLEKKMPWPEGQGMKEIWRKSLEPGAEGDQILPGNLERRLRAGAGGSLAELRAELPVRSQGRALGRRVALRALNRSGGERVEADEALGVGRGAAADGDRRVDAGRVVDERYGVAVEEVVDLRLDEDFDRPDLAAEVEGEVGRIDVWGAIGVARREVVRHARRRRQVAMVLVDARRAAPEGDVRARVDVAESAVGRTGVDGLEQPRGNGDRTHPEVIVRVNAEAMPLVLGEVALRRVPGGLYVLGVVERLVCQGAAA